MRRPLESLFAIVAASLWAAQASAVTLAPAIFREFVSLSCNDGGSFAGASDLAPETVSGAGSGWSGSALTTTAPRVETSFTIGAVTGCVGGVLHRSLADVTYRFAVVAQPGAPSAGSGVRVLIPGVGEATGPSAGLIGSLDFRWDGVSFSGHELVSLTTGAGGTVTLNHTFSLLLLPGDVVAVTLRAICDYRGGPGSCSAFVDPLALIDPTQTVLVGGASHPMTDFFSLQFSPNLLPEPVASAFLAIAGLLLARGALGFSSAHRVRRR